MKSNAQKSTVETVTASELLAAWQDAMTSYRVITRLLRLHSEGEAPISDERRVHTFVRAIQLAEHELDAATRPKAEKPL
jgi:hypothetical protein